jgi:hypothetical protein
MNTLLLDHVRKEASLFDPNHPKEMKLHLATRKRKDGFECSRKESIFNMVTLFPERARAISHFHLT